MRSRRGHVSHSRSSLLCSEALDPVGAQHNWYMFFAVLHAIDNADN